MCLDIYLLLLSLCIYQDGTMWWHGDIAHVLYWLQSMCNLSSYFFFFVPNGFFHFWHTKTIIENRTSPAWLSYWCDLWCIVILPCVGSQYYSLLHACDVCTWKDVWVWWTFMGLFFSQYISYFWQERHWEKSEFVLNVLVTFRGSRLRATCAHAMTVAEPSVSLS